MPHQSFFAFNAQTQEASDSPRGARSAPPRNCVKRNSATGETHCRQPRHAPARNHQRMLIRPADLPSWIHSTSRAIPPAPASTAPHPHHQDQGTSTLVPRRSATAEARHRRPQGKRPPTPAAAPPGPPPPRPPPRHHASTPTAPDIAFNAILSTTPAQREICTRCDPRPVDFHSRAGHRVTSRDTPTRTRGPLFAGQ